MTEKEPWKKKVDLFRQKFKGREDVFFGSTVGHKETKDPMTGENTLIEYRNFAPVCQNYGNRSLCLIAQRRGGCSECTNRALQPVTDAWAYKHISGDADMVVLMLTDQGIRFGAADFDIGDPFEDAKTVRDLSVACGLPCYIARSTKKGYHVYWFFKEWVPAHLFTSYLRYLFTEAGFYQRQLSDPKMRLPEVFPKQIALADTAKFGNGIKVPMIEPKMREGFNCWVMDDKIPLPYEKQWGYLEATHDISKEELEKVLAAKDIEVFKVAASRDLREARKLEGRPGEGAPAKIVPFGSFEEVILGCPAMGKLWAKNAKGEYLWDISNPNGLFHDARVASMMLAIHTKDGEEMLRSRWPTSKTEGAIRQAHAAGYTPISCAWMQERGICLVGRDPRNNDHCMERLPPKRRENGVEIENPDNLPKEQWPAPSPIRFATSRHLDVDGVIALLKQLSEAKKQVLREGAPEIDPATGNPIVNEVYIPSNLEERIAGILKRSARFTPEEQKRIQETVSAEKLIPKKEFNELKKQVAREIKQEAVKKETATQRSFTDRNGNTYYIDEERCCYSVSSLDAKGNLQLRVLTNFIVTFSKEHVRIKLIEGKDIESQHEVVGREYQGVVKMAVMDDATQEYKFRTNAFSGLKTDQWLKSKDAFFRHVITVAGMGVWYESQDIEKVRNAVFHFNFDVASQKICPDVGHYELGGNDVFIAPKTIVTKDEIKFNDLYQVDVEDGSPLKEYDLVLLDRAEAKELAHHLVEDFFYCNLPFLTRTCFAHAMASTMLPQLQRIVHFDKSPLLTLTGNIGGGKTFIAQKTAAFFGPELTGYSIGTTTFAIGRLSNIYRHSLLVLNDYKKSIGEQKGIKIVEMIQKLYDRDDRMTGTRGGQLRKGTSTKARGLLLLTGEDIPNQEASVVSRQIAIEATPVPDFEHGDKVNKQVHKYSGFTAYFIQFLYQMKPEEIARLWKQYLDAFMEGFVGKPLVSSANRICENLTLNMIGFHVAMETMVSLGVDVTIRDRHIAEHFADLAKNRDWIVTEVTDAKGSNQFLRLLSAIIQDTGRYKIENWVNRDVDFSPHAKTIGFCRPSEPSVLFLIPEAVHAAATELAGKSETYIQSSNHISKQLKEDGLLESRLLKDPTRATCVARMPYGGSSRVWPLRLSALGVEVTKDNVVAMDSVEKRGSR